MMAGESGARPPPPARRPPRARRSAPRGLGGHPRSILSALPGPYLVTLLSPRGGSRPKSEAARPSAWPPPRLPTTPWPGVHGPPARSARANPGLHAALSVAGSGPAGRTPAVAARPGANACFIVMSSSFRPPGDSGLVSFIRLGPSRQEACRGADRTPAESPGACGLSLTLHFRPGPSRTPANERAAWGPRGCSSSRGLVRTEKPVVLSLGWPVPGGAVVSEPAPQVALSSDHWPQQPGCPRRSPCRRPPTPSPPEREGAKDPLPVLRRHWS